MGEPLPGKCSNFGNGGVVQIRNIACRILRAFLDEGCRLNWLGRPPWFIGGRILRQSDARGGVLPQIAQLYPPPTDR